MRLEEEEEEERGGGGGNDRFNWVEDWKRSQEMARGRQMWRKETKEEVGGGERMGGERESERRRGRNL